MKQLITDMTGLIGFGLLTAGVYLYAGLPASLMLSGCLLLLYALVVSIEEKTCFFDALFRVSLWKIPRFR
ncbi:hypothetical protein I7646_23625 [Shigella flexneri]|nr:hypothetical protein [Shigella flexneri]